MPIGLRGVLSIMLGLMLIAVAEFANAQKLANNRPVTIVVSYPPGGLSDFYARLVGPKLSESLGVSVIIENRPGANGTIGTASVARSSPDGHTITLVPASTLTSNQWIMKDIGFDPIKDLTPLTLGLIVPNVLVVHPSVEATTVPEFLELLKRTPGKVNYATVGVGSSGHLNAEMLKALTGVDIVHVPYKGAGPAVQDLLGGQVQMFFDNLPGVMPLIESKKLRALAVTSAKSSPTAPDIPPMNKFVPGFELTPWFGFVGPAGMPKDIVALLNDHISRATKSPDIVKLMSDRGGEVVTTSPEEFGELIRRESEEMRKLIATAKIAQQ